jgi:hypothetical protein
MTTPANIPFTEADLVSHVLRMCPLQWQDQYNLHERGMTPSGVFFLCLLRLLSAYVRRRRPTHNPAIKLPTRARKATSNLVLNLQPESQRKLAPRSIATYAKSMRVHILCTNDKDGKEKSNFHAAKKGGKKLNPARHNFCAVEQEIGQA